MLVTLPDQKMYQSYMRGNYFGEHYEVNLLKKKSNDGFHNVCALSMIEVNVLEDGNKMMSMNNKYINIHWLFKAKETAV